MWCGSSGWVFCVDLQSTLLSQSWKNVYIVYMPRQNKQQGGSTTPASQTPTTPSTTGPVVAPVPTVAAPSQNPIALAFGPVKGGRRRASRRNIKRRASRRQKPRTVRRSLRNMFVW